MVAQLRDRAYPVGGVVELSRDLIVWGIPPGETDRLHEKLLAECDTQEQVEKVKEAAAKDGFHSFRVWRYDGSPPDFKGALNL